MHYMNKQEIKKQKKHKKQSNLTLSKKTNQFQLLSGILVFTPVFANLITPSV